MLLPMTFGCLRTKDITLEFWEWVVGFSPFSPAVICLACVQCASPAVESSSTAPLIFPLPVLMCALLGTQVTQLCHRCSIKSVLNKEKDKYKREQFLCSPPFFFSFFLSLYQVLSMRFCIIVYTSGKFFSLFLCCISSPCFLLHPQILLRLCYKSCRLKYTGFNYF